MTPEQYRYLIAELLKTVQSNGGRMRIHDAEIETARRIGISIASMQGIAINAHADHVLRLDWRSSSLTVPQQS